jgi:exodeoxyribonuclease VII large subunit
MAQIEPNPTTTPQITVSELAQSLKRTLEERFGYVRVRGEISGYRGPHTSGHVYFSLKDEGARLDAVIWRTTYLHMRVRPEDGLEVIASGKITTFAGKSSYQIIVESLEPAGVGALMTLLESRRRQLAAEGLFNADRKRPLPFLPRVLGVVTSPNGSVIRDILHRLADRFPTHVILWPVRVQGESSAEEISAAIRGFNALDDNAPVARPDVLIVARGGGSLEDLWSFNDEEVVRAASESKIPLISAVGHETDWTLIDHASDVRAPTPTAAAEISVPVRSELILRVSQLEARGAGAFARLDKQNRANLRAASRRIPSIRTFYSPSYQRLDSRSDAVRSNLRAGMNARAIALAKLSSELAKQSPYVRLVKVIERARATSPQMRLIQQRRLSAARQDLGQLERNLRHLAKIKFERRSEHLVAATRHWESKRTDATRLPLTLRREVTRAESSLTRALHEGYRQRSVLANKLAQLFAAVNYKAVLARGFALVRDRTGAVLSRVEEARAAHNVTIRFVDGEVAASVGARNLRKHGRKQQADTEQKSLF